MKSALAEGRDSRLDGADDALVDLSVLMLIGEALRAPVASLNRQCDFLVENAGDAPLADAAANMRRSTRQIGDLLADLGEFAALASGASPLQPTTFSFKILLAETVDLLKPYAQHKGIFLAYDVRSRTDYEIRADKQRLRQALIHLVKNAIAETENGVVDVTAALAGGLLRVAVRNDGAGPGEAPAENAALGLVMARRLIALMKGRFLLERAPGLGALAGFELPLE